MRIAYFDCFSGVAGDMTLAALLDAGCPRDALDDCVRRLNLPGVSLRVERVKRHGISANHVTVEIPDEAKKAHRHLSHIEKIIDAADLPTAVADNAKRVFRRLAEAEAKVHGTTVEKVHFHEVGAVDAIVDVVGACAGLAELRIDRVVCAPIPTGHGTVMCEHGLMPVPAPATAELLVGVPLAACDEPAELTTPTGAALMTTLASSFGPPPSMRLNAIGVGAGTREGKTRANILRIMIGEVAAADGETSDSVVVLESQIDDATGQELAHAAQKLLEAGALDVMLIPAQMKKGRPGSLLTVLAGAENADLLQSMVLRETPTFGVRRSEARRVKLAREIVRVDTRFGPIELKVGQRGDTRRAWPEYESCAEAARRHEAPLAEVQQEALRVWRNEHTG
ncbi:MAG: nickel pincer cofactor biosynthesis protein LarC [Phycisphaerales bacterium]|nr:nickel pincer cofactor biosynthesis protein LarC [Phycisphaerales bacterium]